MRSSSVTLAILDVLKNSGCHLTAAEVYERVHNRLAALNPSTVYRALDRLAASGLVSRSDIGTGSEVYECVENPLHHHLICHKCGKMVTLDHEQVNLLFETIEAKTAFTLCTNHLVLFGICPECKYK